MDDVILQLVIWYFSLLLSAVSNTSTSTSTSTCIYRPFWGPESAVFSVTRSRTHNEDLELFCDFAVPCLQGIGR